jgi:hypothetical protein
VPPVVDSIVGLRIEKSQYDACTRPRVGHIAPRSCGRVAEGGGLLNRYRVVKPYRGFKSPPAPPVILNVLIYLMKRPLQNVAVLVPVLVAKKRRLMRYPSGFRSTSLIAGRGFDWDSGRHAESMTIMRLLRSVGDCAPIDQKKSSGQSSA